MPSKLLNFIAEGENACCPYGYLVLHSDLTIRKHARTIGVAKETLRLWRKKAALGTNDQLRHIKNARLTVPHIPEPITHAVFAYRRLGRFD